MTTLDSFGAVTRQALFFSLAMAVSGCSAVTVDRPALSSIRSIALVSFDGNVNLGFEDEPSHPSHKLFDPIHEPRPAPPSEVTQRRAEETRAIFAHARPRLEGIGWRVIVPEESVSSAWTRLRAADARQPSAELPRMLQVPGMTSSWLFGDLVQRSRPGSLSPREETLGQLARELDVQAFGIVQLEIDRITASEVGPVSGVFQANKPDAAGRVVPVGHARIRIVDARGNDIADIWTEAPAQGCMAPLRSENSSEESCPIVAAASAALDRAIAQLAPPH
jgi:hypothetical protein